MVDSPNLNMNLQATGDNVGTWGVVTNSNLSIIDLAFGGRQAKTAASSNITLTTDEAQNVFHTITGTLGANIDYIFPASDGRFYYIYNNTSGAFTITAKPSGGTGVVIPQGAVSAVFISPTAAAAYRTSTPSVMTTTGDLIYQASGVPARLAVGGSTAILGVSSGVPAWTVTTPQTVVALSDGATPALNAALGNTFTLTSTTNPTIAVPSNPVSGQRIAILFTASGGSRTLSLNTGAGGFLFGDTIPALTATPSGDTDLVGAIYNSGLSKWLVAAYVKGFA